VMVDPTPESYLTSWTHADTFGAFKSDLKAFEILEEWGLNEKGLTIIKDQVGTLSGGYRHPEVKLADVLDGGAVWTDSKTVTLLHGMGSIERCGVGDCSESTRALTNQWAKSSMARHLAQAGLHPIYLEVAAPRLFTDIWDDGKRIRSGHSVVALGSPIDYLKNGSDESFVLIDPTLGVVEPMVTTSYRQTGFKVVPEVEQRAEIVNMLVQSEDADLAGHEDDKTTLKNRVNDLVLGTDMGTNFIFTLWFRATEDGPAAQLRAIDNDQDTVLKFDSATQQLYEGLDAPESVARALPTFNTLVSLLVERGLDFYPEARLNLDNDQIIVPGRTIDAFKYFRYPRDRKLADYLAGMDFAAREAAKMATHFSLRNNEYT
jgi:hypothetical protein